MVLFIRLFRESFLFAVSALRENLLRTILSLLGVTIGIFAIIAVLTLVDTLDKSIKKSLSFLGSEVIYLEKWPWIFEGSYPWWKYVNRPYPTTEEFTFLQKNLTWAK
ncbi:MAG: ABC transporter permease, partial [Bacteroidota bacterium]